MSLDDTPFIGQRVRQYRRAQGMSQQQLADLIGKDRSYIAHIEGGRTPVQRRETLYALAEALSASVAQLTGQPYEPADRQQVAARAAVTRIQHALMAEGTEVFPGGPARIADLAAAADEALTLRMRADYVALGNLVPNVITDLHAHMRDGDQPAAAAALTRVTFAAAMGLKELGQTPLAWIAATASRTAAKQTGDPTAVAAAEFVRSQVLLADAATARAAQAAAAAADGLDLSDSDALQIRGMLHLQAALCHTVLAKQQHGDAGQLAAAAGHYREAQELAERTGEGRAYQLRFGPANVAVWGLSLAVERDEPGRVQHIASRIDQAQVDTPNRLSRFFIEQGRAFWRDGKPDKALGMLLRAEHAAPHHVRTRPVVRELAGFMLRGQRRKLASGRLGEFASRVGAAPA